MPGPEDWLRRPGLARLWAAARRAFERAGRVGGAVSVRDPSPEERRAIAGLLGRPQGQGVAERVELAALDAALRSSALALPLPEVLLLLGGPLRNRADERDAAARRRESALRTLRSSRHAGAPWFEAWTDGLLASGRLARLDRAGALAALSFARGVLDLLPSEGVAVGVLAWTTTGDPKALDHGALAGIVLSALAAWAEEPLPEGQVGRRRLWERFGVVKDELSSQVLVRALPLEPVGLVGGLSAASGGEPLRLTLRQLLRHPLHPRPEAVYVCENPVLVREAAERGFSSPLVCTEGQPSAAAMKLLRALRAAGCEVLAHADFDAAGLHIVRRLVAEVGASPWRMGVEDYRRGLEAGGHPRVGRGLASPWEPELAAAMEAEGRGVYEEALVDALLG